MTPSPFQSESDVITNPKILKYKAGVAKLEALIKAERAACEHDDEVVKRWDDHDGWSHVTVTYYEGRRCRKCGRYESFETGTGRSYV